MRVRALSAGGSSFFVVFSVVFRSLVPVVGRMQFVRMGHVGVMARLLVIAGFVVLGRFTMMVRCSLMMLGRHFVVAAALMVFALMLSSCRSATLSHFRLRSKSDRRMNAFNRAHGSSPSIVMLQIGLVAAAR